MSKVFQHYQSFLRATEQAAIAAAHLRGCGDEKMADKLRIGDLEKAITATKAKPRIVAWPQDSFQQFYKGWNRKIAPSLGHQASLAQSSASVQLPIRIAPY